MKSSERLVITLFEGHHYVLICLFNPNFMSAVLHHFITQYFVYLYDPELLLNATDVLHSITFKYFHAGISEAHPQDRLNIQMSSRKVCY